MWLRRLGTVFTVTIVLSVVLLTDFQPFDAASHPVVRLEADWNELLDHGLVKPCAYLVRSTGSYYEALNGASGVISYGGADNAGSTDGTDADAVIQVALDNLTSGRAYKERVVLMGSFATDAAITVPSYTTVELHGKLARSGGGAIMQNADQVGGNSFIDIIGGVWDGSGQSSGNGFGFLRVSDVEFRNLYITGVNAASIYVDGDSGNECYRVNIRDCTIKEGRGDAFHLDQYVYDSIIHGCQAKSNTGQGFRISQYDKQITLTNCLSLDNSGTNGFGIRPNTENIVLSNCIAKGHTTQEGFSIQGNGAVLSNCKSIANRYGFQITGSEGQGEYNQLINCYALENEYNGFHLSSEADYNVVTGYAIDNGQAAAATYFGVRIQKGNYNRVTVTSTGSQQDYGIQTSGTSDYNLITGCILQGNGAGGFTIAADGHNTRVVNNLGYNPVGKVANCFDTTNDYLELFGDAATPDASTVYTVAHCDIIISSTDSGNADNAIQIKDPGGNNINPSTLSTLDCYYLPIGYQIDWGAYTGAAPTVVASFT